MLHSGEIENSQEKGKQQTTTISRSELNALGFFASSFGIGELVAKKEYGTDQDIAGAQTINILAVDAGARGCGNPNCCMGGEVKIRHESNDSLSVVLSCSAENCSTEGLQKAAQYIREMTESSLEGHQIALSKRSVSEV